MNFNSPNFVIRPDIQQFHYAETPVADLTPMLVSLQRGRVTGQVIRRDPEHAAVGVLFPGKNDVIWFKEYELKRV